MISKWPLNKLPRVSETLHEERIVTCLPGTSRRANPARRLDHFDSDPK